MSKPTVLPIYFKSLALENIRSFSERQELKLISDDDRPARWTLIVGDNGVGKTTLLQCLARMRPEFNPPSDDDKGPSPAPVEPELAREEDNDVLQALAQSDSDGTARLEARLSVGLPLAATGRRQSKTSRSKTISTGLEIKRKGGRITEVRPDGEYSKDVREPLVLAYGAGRHPRVDNADEAAATTDPIQSLFKVAVELHDAEELLYRLDYSSLRKRPGAGKLLDSLKKMLSEIVPDIQRPEDITILGPPSPGFPSNQTGIHVTTPYGKVPLGQLSLGYQTVVAWTVDIAWRLLERYPESANPLKEPAIVIVDEVDLHLHPRWQREIRQHLTSHFPEVQFIATAHSPLMAQSSLDANLAVLQRSGDHTEIVNDPTVVKSWRLDQVITSDLFDLHSARPPQVEKWQRRRAELVEKAELSQKELTELAKLDQKALELPTRESAEDRKAMDIIRKAAQFIESSSSSS